MSMISGYTVRRVEGNSVLSQGRPRSMISASVGRRSPEQVTEALSLQNRDKSLLDDDATDAFDPSCPAIKAWEHILLLCLLYEGFMVPYFLAFQPEAVGGLNVEFAIAVACELMFLIDCYVQANTGYYADGNLIRDKKLTRRRYLRSYHFVIDLVAITPWQACVLNNPYVLARLSLLKYARCWRLNQFVTSLDELYAKYFVMLKLFKVLLSMVYMAHVLACIRYSFGYNEHHTNHWLTSEEESHHPLHTQYLGSLFWSVGIMTGLFEGELPRHSSEFLFTTLVALCGFSMFTTLVATIFVISKCESGHSEAVEARINQLVHLLSFHRVPECQQAQAIEYLRRYYTDAESNDREAAKRLCRSVANDIQVELLKSTFAQIPIFEGCSDQFIVAMTSLLEMIAVPAQTTLFSAGDDGDAMYIVHSGVLAVIIKSVTVREIRKGACFGELSVFSSIKRTAAVMSTTYSILYKLSRFHCDRVLDGYPDCAALIASHVESTLNHMEGTKNYVLNTVISPRVPDNIKIACIHFAISYIEGFNPNEDEAWISSTKLCLRRLNSTHLENCDDKIFNERVDLDELRNISAMEYSRSLYYAVGVLASPGKSIEPVSDVQLVAALILMLSGFLITAIVVDNVQKRFTASAFEQKEFFATSTRIQLFLRRQNAPLAIHHRVKSFLDYWWSSHRGAVIGELLADLPRPIRLDVLRSICLPVLQTLALLQGIRPVRDKLEEFMVENVRFILYGQGEIVYRHGDYVTGMFFLLEGEVCIITAGRPPREVPRGGFFGTAALTQQERGEGYTEHTELLTLEQRVLNNKLAKSAVNKGSQRRIRRQSTVIMLRNAVFGSLKHHNTVYDPDSRFILTWETWVFFVMTAQWILVMLQACFPLEEANKNADVIMVFMECSFVLDIYIRSRLGFYEYGNKMMNCERIKRLYFRSGVFVLDIVALLPLYLVNWSVPPHERWDLLNINKLLRLFKVPRQLHALETRYLKRTTELRLFKLLYYTFMLSHVFGCIWFNFASKVAVPNFTSTLLPITKKTAFGENHWLPHKHLEHSPHILQYMASLYWSFGLMSASSEPEFPTTTAQCIFSAITMTTGFFLFAYVIGNFTDIIELTTSETREFNAKMGAVRQMLNHFQLPEALQERLKTFFLFKRFHTITQEHILVHCLPPSLLTDIRLVHLKRMIEKVEFLSGMEGSVTRMLVSQFTQVLVSRGEFICRLGEKSSDMYFVFTGVLDVLLPLGAINTATNPNMTIEKKGSEKVKNGAPAKLWRLGVRQNSRATSVQRSNSTTEQLKKVNEISAGSYFGENGLFTNGRRNAYIQAQTSCILYKLSRESLELVFDRYPEWKEKVMRIVNIHREQTRLLQLSREEQRRGTDATTGLMLSRADIMNERAERIKDELQHVRLQYGESRNGRFVADTSRVVLDLLERFILTPFHCLVEGTEVQSNFHLSWLRFMVVCIVYVSILTPYQLAMDDLDRFTPMAIVTKAFGLLCELVFILDVWFSWHVRESPASMELYEQDLRATYKKERMLWDTIAAIPFYRFLSDFHCRSWLKLLRCLKIFNVVSYLDELNRRSVTYEITRFWYICLLYLLMIYWAACAYLVVATEVGFGTEWDAWLPSQELVITNPGDPSPSQLALRFLRGLFFATTTFVKKARNLAPDTATLYAFHIAVSFVGLITMSFVLGELASLFISYIGLEVDFRKNHIAIEIYLDRLHVSDRLKARAHAFMTSLWSSHAGVNYEEILGEMPRSIRTACVLHVSKEPVDWFIRKVITPMCWEGSDELELFRHSLVEHLHFEGYPSDESIVVEGSIARAMYFVLRGHVQLHSRSLLALKRPIGLRRGDFFGERGLLGSAISAYTVQSVRACDVLSLSSEALVEVMDQYRFSHLGLRICECAYGHLKKKNLVACSKMDLEEHWGAALLEIVDELRRRYKKCIGVRAATLAARLSSRVRSSNALMSAGSLTDSVTSRLDSVKEINVENDDCARDQVKAYPEIKADELPKDLDRMFDALTSDKDCYMAFSPLLQILMPSDPLDWNATFRHVNTAAHGENEVAPVALGRRAWLNNRHLDALAKASGGSDQVNIQEDADHVSPVNLQQEQDKKPQEATPSRSAQATSIVSRIRGVNAAAEKLNPSVETQEAVAFSMQDTSRKPRNALVFDGDENTSAPPVHVLRKRSTGDPSGSSSKSAFLGDADVESLE
ncbi:hypothetical protein PC118_g18850 [Phytophthora cactorum]|uniref:Cyclic nucleotide-binding domain-containing protein n=1 Tax=Phytophthora cactorum TaxID=29920 RepID=A0A8T1F3Q5_9STRA|nr:hypothetical protein PC118_g18850 [Phytophthora cactorum]